MTAHVPINSPEAIQFRLAKGRIPHFGPILMLFARPALLLVAQGIVFLLFMRLHVHNAAVALRNWSSVFGTLVDFGCLGLLISLTKREGIRLRDLIGFEKKETHNRYFARAGHFHHRLSRDHFGGWDARHADHLRQP